MVKSVVFAVWMICVANINLNATDQVIAISILEKAKRSGLIQPYMQAYQLITANEAEFRASNYSAIAETDVDISDLPNLRAYCWQPTYLSKTGIANAMTEFRVLEGIVVYGKAPKLRMLPPHVLDYINRLEEERQKAQKELERAQRVVLMPADQLENSPQFSPARPRNAGSIFVHNQTELSLVHTPDRSCIDGAIVFARLEYSPGGNTLQNPTLDRKILNMRREQNALMSPLRRRATEAEIQRDTLLINFQTLGDAHEESQRVLGLQAECFQCQSKITRIMNFVEQDTAAMNGNFLRLREMRNSLEILKSNLRTTLEALQIISGELPGTSF